MRFGVSLDVELLERFDALCTRRGAPSRSEALRDMIREELARETLEEAETEAAGVLTLVYDHHTRDLSRKLIERQHDAPETIVATLHVHLDHHQCLEMLVLRGQAGRLRALADQLRAVRGVRQGTFSFTPVGPDSA